MKQFLILSAILILSVNAKAQTKTKQVYAFSLEECVSFAKNNNVQVKNSLLAIDAQMQTNREIAAAAFPTIGTNAGVNDFLTIPTSLLPAQIFGGAAGTYIPVQFGTKSVFEAGCFSGFSMWGPSRGAVQSHRST